VIRPALLARERGLPFSALLASIVFERILDALAQLAFLGIALFAGVAGESGALSSGRVRWVVAGVAAVAVGIALFAVIWRSTTERILERLFRILPEVPGPPRCGRAHVPGCSSRSDAPAALVGAGRSVWGIINVQIWA
jgi:predicted cobalt transporter CbtA